MEAEVVVANFMIPEHVWLELHPEGDACDVIVGMEDGTVYTALFATVAYMHRQMDLCYQVTQQIPDTPSVRYATLDTPHILVETLDRNIIEDTIDNLLTLDVFGGLFTRVTQDETEATQTTGDGKLATQEVAAVVISDVLVVEES